MLEIIPEVISELQIAEVVAALSRLSGPILPSFVSENSIGEWPREFNWATRDRRLKEALAQATETNGVERARNATDGNDGSLSDISFSVVRNDLKSS